MNWHIEKAQVENLHSTTAKNRSDKGRRQFLWAKTSNDVEAIYFRKGYRARGQ